MVTLRKAKQLQKYTPADAIPVSIETFHNWLQDVTFYKAMYNEALWKARQDLDNMRIMRRYTKNLLAKAAVQKAARGTITRGTRLKLEALGIVYD